MPANSLTSFADALRQHHLLEAAQLDELGRDLQPHFPEPRALAGELIRRGWLTPYQANQLLQGRGDQLLLGSYVLLERLGEGGMGAVFKARNWKLGQVVALKLIRKERVAKPDAVRRFHREIRAAAQLDHPNIVRAIDADEVGGTHLLVMEYAPGVDLAKLVKQQGPLPAERACDFCRQAALGLQHAYEKGLVHRDIKPQNLLLTAQGMVKILDMGLARVGHAGEAGEESSTMTQEGAVMGTLDFIAPEQAMDSHSVDIRADLYSLGCTLYYLLTGKVPFPGGTAMEKLVKHQSKEPAPVERLRPGLPPGLTAMVRKLMAKRPEERYQTPAEAAAALAAAGQAPAAAAAPAAVQAAEETVAGWSFLNTPPSGTNKKVAPPSAPWRPSPWLLGTAAGVALLALGLTVLFLSLPRPPSPPPVAAKPAAQEPAPPPREDTEAAFEKWARGVAALPAEKQGDAVAAELKRRNPGFDGKVKATVENGVVTGLEFLTDDVTDIRPARALPELKSLYCKGSDVGKGHLSDLSPLKDMKLVSLSCRYTAVSDLWPLKGMNLTWLACNDTRVSDLSPLRGMPLTVLDCNGTRVADLTPLKGMPLDDLYIGGTPVIDLSPLKGMRLKYLYLWKTSVSDLSPLKEMPLAALGCDGTAVSDLSPLKDMKLEWLWCNETGVTDFSPLKNMPLKELRCDFDPKRDAAILRVIPTLETINRQPAAEFWWAQEVAALPAEKQGDAVAAELKRRNPGFDGKVKATVENGVVTGLEFLTDDVTDIRPVRALPGLKSLICNGSDVGKGRLCDLSPLKDMNLVSLSCGYTAVADLSPLKGLKLTWLACNYTKVSDLSPLRGMTLTLLNCGSTQVSDLSPLRDMKLTYLALYQTRVADVSPLRGMPLTLLNCDSTQVSDLSPVKDAGLTDLQCANTPISDLSPLKDMKLAKLWCNDTKVTDLSPLKNMPLKELRCDFDPKRDAATLRAIPTLETINGQPAAEFLKRAGAAP